MTEVEPPLELRDVFCENTAETQNIQEDERQEFENYLLKTIGKGDVNKITERVTPRSLTKCKTNALLMALKVNSELHRLADRKGPDEEEITKLANSVDQFTTSLLDPLRSNREARHAFGDSLEDIMDVAIELEQKTFCAHPVVYNLLSQRWYGELGQMRKCHWLSVQRWKWLFLNIWCLLDVMLFPVLFAFFYVCSFLREKALRNKERELAFIISATSKASDLTFNVMKSSVKYVIQRFTKCRAKFHVIVRGEEALSKGISFTGGSSKISLLLQRIDKLNRETATITSMHKDLRRASEAFVSFKRVEKIVIFITDHKTSGRREKELAKDQIKRIKRMGARIFPVGIGPHVSLRELERIKNDGKRAIHFGEYEDPRKVGKRIMHEIKGKDLYELYLEYFTTPYFIFVRDTLSYLALLGLHFAICLAPTSLEFSGVEWAILVFFVGRVVMEGSQLIDAKVQHRDGNFKLKHVRTYSRHNSLNSAREADIEQTQDSAMTRKILLKRFRKYLSDRWNILDFITLLIYFITFILRIITWTFFESVTNNRTLVVAEYLYGVIALFLTLRAFGHMMEAAKGVGSIQIALFHILFDVVAILGQFAATILAFALAMTKIYMAQRSYVPKGSFSEDRVCNEGGITCWIKIAEHLGWSLLGMPNQDTMKAYEAVGETLLHILYGFFLIMGVVFIINMMIALLSNTYQRVEDNSLKEWSFKKAITIQTYSDYHPIPVPLNLVSNFFLGLWRLYWLCKARCQGQKRKYVVVENKRNDAMDTVVKNLQLAYVIAYGYSFPLTDERKMDHVLLQTEQNRQMANQIAHLTFAVNRDDQNILPSGSTAWESKGITVSGCLLTNEGAEFCDACGDCPSEIHGARYIVPFSLEFPHLEVLIQETGEWRILGVGVVWEGYDVHTMPGLLIGSVGYHTDDGKIFHSSSTNVNIGVEIEDAMAYRGDLIGCTVKFEMAADGKVPIVFTLNGKQISQEQILMQYNPRMKLLYPYIGMGNKGIRVLAKMCRTERRVTNQLTTFQKRDEHTLARNEIVRVLNALEKLKKNAESKFDAVDEQTNDISQELAAAGANFESLKRDVLRRLVLPKEASDREGGNTGEAGTKPAPLAGSDSDTEGDTTTLQKTVNFGMLKEVNDGLTELEKMICERFKTVSKTLTQTKTKAKEHTENQQELRKELNKTHSRPRTIAV